MNKFLWFDTETTGIDPVKQDIIQIAGQIVIKGIVKEEFNLKCQPFSYDNIKQKALDINKITVDQLKTFPSPQETYQSLVDILDKYCNKYNKKDKFIPAGQNVKFDIDFTNHFFKKNGNDFFFSYISPAPFDLMQLALILEVKEKRKIFVPNYKLETIYQCMIGNKMKDSHDALADIQQTKDAAKIIWWRLFNK